MTMYKMMGMLCFLGCFVMHTTPLLAKGMPTKPDQKAQAKDPKKVAEKEAEVVDDDDDEKEPPPPPQTALSKDLANKLSLHTSYGFLRLTKQSVNWLVLGATDISVGYALPNKLFGAQLAATLRYIPMAVTPQIKSKGITNEFKGTIQSYGAGGELRWSMDKSWTLIGEAEAALLFTHLHRYQANDTAKLASGTGVELYAGSRAEWEIAKGFNIGPNVRVGMGTYTILQLSAAASFMF